MLASPGLVPHTETEHQNRGEREMHEENHQLQTSQTMDTTALNSSRAHAVNAWEIDGEA